MPGAQEWRTSTYSYNKAAIKTLPTAAETTNTLLEQYAVMRAIQGAPSSRTAIAKRRKDPLKKYVSRAGVKDFGDRVRIDAYVYDEQESAAAGGKSRAPRGKAPGGRSPAPQ